MSAKTGNADRVLAILKKGQRCSVVIAKDRLGLGKRQYQRAISVLKGRGLVIDSDLKAVQLGGKRVWIAVHQIVRNA